MKQPGLPVILAGLLLLGAQGAGAAEEQRWRLRGGGEIVGWPVKESTSEVYIDVGPRILSVPKESILDSTPLSVKGGDAQTSRTTTRGSGVFDIASGALVFKPSEQATGTLSRNEILDRAKRSVVLISNPHGAGSGFVLDREGRILTNHHVVANERYHTVNLFVKQGNQWDRKKIDDVKVEAYSALYDIAVLKLEPSQLEKASIELFPLPLAAPESLEAGDSVFVIGNPGLGRGRLLEHSISEGIVSNLTRNFGDVLYIQTTAAVNPGNSGGPMLDQSGNVVGLVTLKATYQEGIAFALPVSLMLQFLRHSQSYAVGERSEDNGFRYLTPE